MTKVWVTKKSPNEFVRSGFDCLEFWFFTKPFFTDGYSVDKAFCGLLDWKDAIPCKWNGQFSIPGRMIRKIAPNKTKAIWQALLRSYDFDINSDLYDPVDKGFTQAKNDFYKDNHLFSLNTSNSPSNNLSMALNKHVEIKCNRYASAKVERSDCLWWEWCIEIDMDIEFDTGVEIDES
jgi:hypothetical protein